MDERLARISGMRPGRLLQGDLPNVAKAIVLHLTGGTDVVRTFQGGLEYVLFTGGAKAVILASDWDKVLPYLQEGYFEPSVYPTPRVVVRDPMHDDPSLETSPYRAVYDRTLTKLRELFPDDYP